ncbi:MAG: hypothetical protein M3443_07650, partial [Actinomycetota bacterium]|nr:hypothetical protein [Actinomycetota bacterium]
MKTLSTEAIELAETFMLVTARLLERRRYAFHYGLGEVLPGDGDAVVAALDAYRNPDGGYGNALEPDGRGPGSQPITVLSALSILIEVDALSASRADPLCAYLQSITADNGGIPFIHPNARDYPRAPWWQLPDISEGSLLPTANLVGAMWQAGVTHSWVDSAAEFCWPRIEALTSTHPYEAIGCMAFLDHAPERARAEALAARIGDMIRSSGYVRLRDAEGTTPTGYNSA